MDSRPRAYCEYVWKTRPSTCRKQLRPGISNGWSPRRLVAHRLELGLGPVVVRSRPDGLVDRDAEVVVEVAAVRRVPGDVPAPLRLVPLQLLQRRPRHHGVAGVAGVEVVEEARRHLVGAGGAARAALLPVGVEHEVVDDQLAAGPRTGRARRTAAVRAVEHVVLLDLHHGEVPALGVQRVPLAGSAPSPSPAAPCGRRATRLGGDPRQRHLRLLSLSHRTEVSCPAASRQLPSRRTGRETGRSGSAPDMPSPYPATRASHERSAAVIGGGPRSPAAAAQPAELRGAPLRLSDHLTDVYAHEGRGGPAERPADPGRSVQPQHARLLRYRTA